MAKLIDRATFDVTGQLPAAVSRPLYAGLGATDRAVEVLRGAVADVQQRTLTVQQEVQKTVSALDYRPEALRRQATEAVSARVDAFGKDAQARRRVVEQRVAGLQAEAKDLPVRLQKLVDTQVATATETYDELVKRGEVLVGRIRRQPSTKAAAKSAHTTEVKAKTTRTQAAKTAGSAKRSASRTTRATAKKAAKSPARSSAKATATSAKKTASSAARATTDAAAKIGD